MKYQLINPIDNTKSPIQQILTNRGIALKDIEHFLNTTDNDILNPLGLDNIELAAKTLIQHISNGSLVYLPVDPDCDGMTSAAIFINYLYKLFPSFVKNNLSFGFPEGKHHGVIAEAVPKGVSLVVAIDSSSSSYEETQKLKERNIDIIVLDHHETDAIDPNAIIVNNQTCDYPTKSLSGAGIAYKFCSYIDSLLNKNYAEDLLDLASLGMIADMVPLKDFETRRIITKGLSNINNTFFSTMVERNSFQIKDELTPDKVAFYIAPYINATIRSGTLNEKLMLFEALLEHKALDIIASTKRGCSGQYENRLTQAIRNCTNVKKRQTTSRDKNYEIIKELIEKNDLLAKNKILIICLPAEQDMNKSLTGLVANQLQDEYKRPVLILHEVGDNWEGSGRAEPNEKFSSFRSFLQSTNLINWAQGHANALGCSIHKDNLEKFINYTNAELADVDFTIQYEVDFIYDSYNFKSNDILEIAKYKSFWGQEVDEPMVAIENVKITKDNIILMSPDRNPTLKIKLPNGVELIKFKSSEEEFKSLKPKDTGAITLTIVGTCDSNFYNGTTTGQILIEDYEITKEIQFYF